jgi:HSP20 family protein
MKQDRASVQQLPLAAYRREDRLTVAAPMPGLQPEDIVVEVDATGRVTLHGERRGALKDDKQVLLEEWTVGPYHREYDPPVGVDGERATATYGNGVLVVALPIAERPRPARLTLEAAGPGHGERVGSAGRPIRATSTAEHRRAVQAQQAAHGGGESLHAR